MIFYDDILIYQNQFHSSNKIAGFDLDSTLIKTVSGNVHPKSITDWTLNFHHDLIVSKMQKLENEGYKIVIFSNQKGISKNKPSPTEFEQKLVDILKALSTVKISHVFVATGSSRKPSCTMWELMESQFNEDVKVNRTESMYVGDAAGRPAGWIKGRKKDFSCSDRKFALNLGVQFYTPEEFFLNASSPPFEIDGFNPHSLSEVKFSPPSLTGSSYPELIVMVGYPASGKSTIYRDIFAPLGYKHINQDTLKTKTKCEKALREALSKGHSAVVDNTNPSKESRYKWLRIAAEFGIPPRCVWMNIPRELADHLNAVQYKRDQVPSIAYNIFSKSFEKPSIEEGFTEVIELTFSPRFESDEHRRLFFQYT